MTLRKRTSLFKIIIRHFFVSIFLGCIPTLLLSIIAPTKTDFIKKLHEMIPNNIILYYFMAGCAGFLLLSIVLKFFWTPNPNVRGIVQFIRDSLKELASGFNNIIQAMVGAIFALCIIIILYEVEPQSFTFSQLGVLLIFGFSFIGFLAIIEFFEHNIERCSKRAQGKKSTR